MAKIGFIGLGIMGKPMALNLIKGGHTLFLHSRSGVAPELTAAGGAQCASSKEVAQKSDVIITMLPDTPDVERVLFGTDGVADGLAKGKTVVDMSSISAIATKTFAQRINALGCEYLDAPVSGGEVGAKNASLTIMVGGSPAAFGAVEPIFALMGKNITLIGGNGDGQTCKTANQIIVALTIEAVSEALVFASKAGADPSKVRQALMGGFASSRILEVHGERMIAHVRSRLPDRAPPEGSEPRPEQRPDAWRRAAEHGHRAANVQRLHRSRRRPMGPLGDGPRVEALANHEVDLPPALSEYIEQVKALNPDGKLRHYPGSPQIALQMLRPQDHLESLPMSDGGDGFGAILGRLLGAEPRRAKTEDAAHRPIHADWWWNASARTAIIESARVIGLAMLPPGQFTPLDLDTYGLGTSCSVPAAAEGTDTASLASVEARPTTADSAWRARSAGTLCARTRHASRAGPS
jgi:2-hydroxy-3-oxopropionate reductase